MIVAVPVVRMMQVPVDEVVDVPRVGDTRVTARGAVNVASVVRATLVRGARRGVLRRRADLVIVDVVAVDVVKVPVVQEIDVVVVLDAKVAAAGAVDVLVILVRGVFAHGAARSRHVPTAEPWLHAGKIRPQARVP